MARRARVERGEQETEVAQGDVVEVADQQQVGDDPGQPGGDQVAAEAGTEGDDESGDDLDRAYAVHEGVGLGVEQVGELGCQVLVPVDEDVGELVEAEQDRGHDEGDPQ